MSNSADKSPLTHVETTFSSHTNATGSSGDLARPSSRKQETQHVEFGDQDDSSALDRPSQDAVRSDIIARFLGLSQDARLADGVEKQMPLLQALRQYPKAALWSVVLSSALIMEGYDTSLLSSLYALPAFARRFGSYNEVSGIYEVPARWQTALSMCVNVGEIIGLQFAGIAADHLGYRRTLIASLLAVFAFIFILFFATGCPMLAAGEILCGIPWGCFQTLTVAYATEVCPLALRYYLTTFVNVCWILGQIMAAGVLKNSQENLADSPLAYRIPFALQWVWPLPIALGIYLAPESPWWLVKKERMADAAHSLSRLISGLPPAEKATVIGTMLKRIQLTTQKEDILTKNASYRDCLIGSDGRRTRIASLTWVTQNACGVAMMTYSTYFYTKAGLSESYAFTFSIIQYCFGLIGTILSWFISKHYGRYEIFARGLALQTLLLIIIGASGFSDSKNAKWVAGTLLLVFVFVYDVGVGPVTYCLVPEIPSNKLRTKTVILARNCYNIMGIVNAIWTPYMLNSDQWNWGAKTGLFWGAISLVMLIWAYYELPETKGRTFGEIDELFSQGVPARKFESTEVNPYDSSNLMSELDVEQIERIVRNDDKSRRDQLDINNEG